MDVSDKQSLNMLFAFACVLTADRSNCPKSNDSKELHPANISLTLVTFDVFTLLRSMLVSSLIPLKRDEESAGRYILPLAESNSIVLMFEITEPILDCQSLHNVPF